VTAATSLPKKTDLDRLNDLISFYEQHRPDAGKVIEVRVTAEALGKMLGRGPVRVPGKGGREVDQWPDSVEYRGRTLLARPIIYKRAE
jgi:hypothetical protein